jgi:CheY-like chemotaxis protein
VVSQYPTVSTYPYLILVEDDPDDQEIMVETATHLQQQLSIKMLADGEELFDLLDGISDPKDLPALIVLDFNLPRLGGEATLVLLKKDPRYKKIPVVIYSTSMTPEKEHDLLQFGANFCRKKPSTIDGIHHLIGEFIGFALCLIEARGERKKGPK